MNPSLPSNISYWRSLESLSPCSNTIDSNSCSRTRTKFRKKLSIISSRLVSEVPFRVIRSRISELFSKCLDKIWSFKCYFYQNITIITVVTSMSEYYKINLVYMCLLIKIVLHFPWKSIAKTWRVNKWYHKFIIKFIYPSRNITCSCCFGITKSCFVHAFQSLIASSWSDSLSCSSYQKIYWTEYCYGGMAGQPGSFYSINWNDWLILV